MIPLVTVGGFLWTSLNLGRTRYYSREEFRQWCEAQTKGRYERVDGFIVAMAPERGAHLRVKGAVLVRRCPMARRWKPATVTTSRTPW